MTKTDAERLHEAKWKARNAIEALMSEQLRERHLAPSHKAHILWRYNNPDQVVERLLTTTLLDRLEVTGL